MSSVMNCEGITRSLWLVSFVNASGGYVDVGWWFWCFLHDKMIKVDTMIDMWISYIYIYLKANTSTWPVIDSSGIEHGREPKAKIFDVDFWVQHQKFLRQLRTKPELQRTGPELWGTLVKTIFYGRTSTPDIGECSLQVSKARHWRMQFASFQGQVPDTSKRLITKRPLFRWTCATSG